MNNGHPLLMIKNSKKNSKKLNLNKWTCKWTWTFGKTSKLQKVECHMSTLHMGRIYLGPQAALVDRSYSL